MAHRSIGLAATLVAAVFAAACDQAPPSAPPDGPEFAQGTGAFACVFSGNPSLGNASNAYFTTSADRKTASDIIAVMQSKFTGGNPYAGARDAGFDLLSFVGKVSRGGTAGDTANGGALVRQAIQCMFDVDAQDNVAADNFFGWPNASQFDFGRALASAAGGAFFVRGGSSDPVSAAVVANDVSRIPFGGQAKDGNVSGLAPDAAHNWSITTGSGTTLKTGILSNRVLIYGQPVSEGYDWKLVPRATTVFDPNVNVALCPAATTASGTSADMITQAGIGVLGYVNADAICGTDPATLALGGSTFDRLTRYAARMLAPAPLQAAVLATTPVGGTARTAKGDVFQLRAVQNVTLTMTLLNGNTPKDWPATLKVNTNLGNIEVDVQTATLPKSPVGGVTVSLSAVNNNGFTQVGQIVSGTCRAPAAPQITVGFVSPTGAPAATKVTWNNACITKTGIVSVVATSAVAQRSGGLGQAESPKFNVKPK